MADGIVKLEVAAEDGALLSVSVGVEPTNPTETDELRVRVGDWVAVVSRDPNGG